MAFLTFGNLRQQTFNKSEAVNLSYGNSSYGGKRVFLSYRREDREWVQSIVAFLTGLGVSIYVDYLDQTLEDNTSESVAVKLRTHISNCTKFLCLATPNSSKSKWMPWELGLGDRIVNYTNVAILPLTNDSNSFGDQEYGKIYGQVSSKYVFSVADHNDWFITYPNGSTVKLIDWLRS
ncbi:toll/interleukin-1 receptor domain-containing protein [Pedobacter sp. B4-66]|uniref:toll/interleukin-1 receptor domain-containing protein n=1 Tax=Pedobacter sp. B4-66 TaxID=2817280 RepID=UPI001BDA5F21|nr:toll/interleukin-1 receptor domain-containing protein [Pedobacter sp. B4-66]